MIQSPCFLRPVFGLFWLLVFLSGPVIADETLVFCQETSDMRPWIKAEGGGLNVELLNRVSLRLGVRFDYRGLPWKRCLAELKANRVSGVIGASFKKDRMEFGAYPGGDKPDANRRLNSERYVLLRRKGGAVSWDGQKFSNLDGPVGIQLGYSVGEHLRMLGVAVDDGAQKAVELAQKIFAGRLPVASLLEGEARTLLEENQQLAGQLEILPVPLLEKPYFLLLSHALVNERADLADKLWRGIEIERKSGEYQKLERETLSGARSQ